MPTPLPTDEDLPDLSDTSLSTLRADGEADAVLAGAVADYAIPAERPVRGFNSYVLTELG